MTPEERVARTVTDLARVTEALSDNYTHKGVRIWLNAPNKLLGGECAIDLIRRGEGERVLAVVRDLNADTKVGWEMAELWNADRAERLSWGYRGE